MRLAATIAAIIATLVVGLVGSALRSEEPHLQMIRVSLPLTPLSAGGTFLDADVAVNNASTTTAKGCYAKAFNHLLFSEEIDETTELGRSEQFDLPPHSGHVPTVNVHLPNLSGETLVGGGVRAPIFYRTECKNAESSDEGRTITVSGLASGS
jgi:hypothetical protein